MVIGYVLFSREYSNVYTNLIVRLPCSCTIMNKELSFPWWPIFYQTSSNGNIFRVTGYLCGDFTGHRWIPHTKSSGAELWCLTVAHQICCTKNNKILAIQTILGCRWYAYFRPSIKLQIYCNYVFKGDRFYGFQGNWLWRIRGNWLQRIQYGSVS